MYLIAVDQAMFYQLPAKFINDVVEAAFEHQMTLLQYFDNMERGFLAHSDITVGQHPPFHVVKPAFFARLKI